MKKHIVRFFCLLLLVQGLGVSKAYALDNRTSTILTMSGYGAASGGLLGMASLAFNSDGGMRRVFQGASLGLYAGIAFGLYVVLSYEYRIQSEDRETIPEGADSSYEYNYGSDPAGPSNYDQYWVRKKVFLDYGESFRQKNDPLSASRTLGRTPIALNLFQYSF